MLRYKINPKTNFKVGEDGHAYISVGVPLQADFAVDGEQNRLMKEQFFEKIKADVLPKTTDMEKSIVYPAIKKGDGTFELAEEIEINLHFRKRTLGETYEVTDGWLTNDKYEWNTKGYDLVSRARRDIESYDSWSDLVGYLGFTDDDIYYQKTKVKKSFLRLMYYDSKEVLNKNMIGYSTAFLDSGKLFSKFLLMKNNEILARKIMDTEQRDNEMVMFEPDLVGPEYHNLRLSTRITLKDKFHNDASSDGFYLYMFRQDLPSKMPMDLYLRAEFNNAKYGKTVNLMLPTDDDKPIVFSNSKFPKSFTIKNEGKTNFNFDAYNDSLFVHLQCRYDEELDKYIYYFPWVSNDDSRKITLNFFEPRLNEPKKII